MELLELQEADVGLIERVGLSVRVPFAGKNPEVYSAIQDGGVH